MAADVSKLIFEYNQLLCTTLSGTMS